MPLGDPDISFDIVKVYSDCGVDILEMGVPSKTPYMDGEVVASSMHRSLATGMDVNELCNYLKLVRQACPDLYMVLMGYEEMPVQEIVKQTEEGVDAILQIGTKQGTFEYH